MATAKTQEHQPITEARDTLIDTCSVDLDGHTFFHDRSIRRELGNRLVIRVDDGRATFLVGVPGEDQVDELVFDEQPVVQAVTQVIDAMRRRAYRHQAPRATPKPRRTCDVCQDSRAIRNPYSGEMFRCPVCG